ncbi:hypothetical protein [Arthrobacter sp. 24S4-2]|uniref:hypothetical protein n=1 Tax=Arthrobacter sp. 24S4-2 TaxID=2575374 RepID=UPI0020C74D34|nr:hypothetical protein [Arthrobacter sp. 24S4-2]
MSNPQEPYQPDAGGPPQWQQPAVPQPPGPQYEAPQYGAPQYGAPQHGAPQPPVPPYAPPGQQEQYGVPGPYGAPGQQPPVKSRRKVWIVLGIAGGVLLLAIVGVVLLVNLVGGATSKARGLADDFTQRVIAGDTDKAYDDFLDPALQDKLSKEEFAAGVQSLELNNTCKPSYNDVKVSTENGNNSADVAGIITCDGKEVDLAYRFDGNKDMKMINIKLRPKA